MPPKKPVRKLVLTATARDDLAFWEKANPKIIQKINVILESVLVDPQSGIGNPEKLKYGLSDTLFCNFEITTRDSQCPVPSLRAQDNRS
jgi:hypothetical protein